MNFIASECSSGCESGWTNYFEQSLLSANPSKKKNIKKNEFCEEEEEDLSMVSDASSGPPHFYEDKAYSNDGNQLYHEYMVPQGVTLSKNGGGKRRRNKQQQQRRSLQVHEDDDTASSPFINYSKNNSNQAQMGFSATHFEGGIGSNFQDHFGCFQSSSPSAKQPTT